MANFYITDRKYNLIDIVSTDGQTEIVANSIVDTQSIEDSARDFEATFYFEDDSFKLAKKLTSVGNFVLYKHREGQSVFITIESREINATDCLVQITGKDASIDLINEVVAPYTPDKAYSIVEYITRFTNDSGFEIGENAIPDKKLKLEEWTSEATALERILSVATRFDVEISFSFEIDGLDVVKRYINIVEKRGKNENITLYANKEIESITIKEDSYDLFTAIKPVGAVPEGKETPINLNNYKYTDPDGRYVLSGGILKDNKVVQEWSRLLSNEVSSPTGAHITRYKEYDTDNQAKLFTMAMTDLKKYAQTNINYEVAFYEFPTSVSIGDTINLVDEDKEIYLSARVLTLSYDYISDTAEAVVGDYLIKDSGISKDLENLAASMKDKFANVNENLNGKAVIVKSDTAPEPNENTIWVDTSSPDTPIKTYDPETGEWLVSTGEKGKDGIAGKDGVGLKETVIRYAGSLNGEVAPTNGWQSTVPIVLPGNFLWTRTTWVYTDNTSEVGYSVSRIGADGNDGEDGIAGKDGTGIKSTTITYVGSTNGTTPPSNGWTSTIPTVADGNYLWTKTVWLYTDNTSETGYSVAKMGATGADGKDGIAGKDGVGIKNTTIQYASSTSGTTAPTTGWQTNVPTVAAGNYLWTKNTWTYTDNTTEVGYAVSRIGKDGNTGKDGIAGKDGVGIKASSIQYAGSTSGTTPPTTGWTATVSTVASGSYLWTKTTWSYTDDTNETGYSVSRMGETGAKGDTGDSATSYWVTPSVNTIQISATKVLNPTTVTFTGYSKTGTANAGLYAGRFNILTSVDGIVYSSKYSSSANQSAYTYTVPADVKFIKARMYQAGSNSILVDEVTIPIIESAEDLEIGGRNYFKNSDREVTNPATTKAEFLNDPNWDMAPIFDAYGVDRFYTISFDLKSKVSGNILVYSQNGSGTKYNIGTTNIQATTTYQRYSITFKPTLQANSTETRALLAFYGVYDSGRVPTVKNLMIETGTKASDWQPALEDAVTYQRWSNDPNGLVDMTDTYPNENLLLGTSNEVQSASGTGWFDGTRATNATQTPPELEFSTNYTYSAYLTAPSDVEAYIYVRLSRPGAPNGSYEDKRSNGIPAGKSGLAKVTFSIPTDTTTISFRVLRFAVAQTSTKTIKWSREKLELGSNVTTWTSNQQEDKLLAVPQYVGVGVQNTMNPSDFTWTINPEYTQARTDVGLDAKLDEETFNDASDHLNELIDSKANQDELAKLNDIADALKESYEGFTAEGGRYEADLQALEARVTGLLIDLEDKVLDLDFLKTNMRLGEEGFEIGQEGSSLKMVLDNNVLSFRDGGREVAYFSNQEFYINRGAILESLQVGSHKLTKVSAKMTVFQYAPPK